MNAVASHDTLTIVNGPEDGTEFPLTQRSFMLGSDSECAVNVRLDGNVLPLHGRLVAVADGYRVRSTHGGRILANGRRIGLVRSQIVRHGDIVRVGDTDLALTCCPGGLAQRSRGTRIESDLFWATREVVRNAMAIGLRAINIVRGTLGFMWAHPVWTAAGVLTIAYWRAPAVHAVLTSVVTELRGLF